MLMHEKTCVIPILEKKNNFTVSTIFILYKQTEAGGNSANPGQSTPEGAV